MLTGQSEEGYQGGFMLQYEINMMAGGSVIYIPDPTRFSDEHIDRFTLSRGNEYVFLDAMLGLICDLPHEIIHLLQLAANQTFGSGEENGWLAENDPSICCLNLLKFILIQNDIYDEYNVEGLFEAAYMWMAERIIMFHNKLSSPADAVIGYKNWRESCGYVSPGLDTDIETDYCKVRASLEAFPIDAAFQLSGLFQNRSGHLRDLPRPERKFFFPTAQLSIWTVLNIPNND
jgi:hypothetical protein